MFFLKIIFSLHLPKQAPDTIKTPEQESHSKFIAINASQTHSSKPLTPLHTTRKICLLDFHMVYGIYSVRHFCLVCNDRSWHYGLNYLVLIFPDFELTQFKWRTGTTSHLSWGINTGNAKIGRLLIKGRLQMDSKDTIQTILFNFYASSMHVFSVTDQCYFWLHIVKVCDTDWLV